jgi:apolipoprotein D and lipocalin family protein
MMGKMEVKMKKSKRIVLLQVLPFVLIMLISWFRSTLAQNDNQELGTPVTVHKVDLNRYAGTWYEIARIPNRFQDQCVKNVTATYELREDGKIDVINRCVEDDGSIDEAEGIAQVVDESTFSKLEVSFVSFFGIRPFWGDYWILGLEENYKYAVVGDPSRDYGWILSRSQKMKKEDLNACYEILRKQGYDPDKFIKTIQE